MKRTLFILSLLATLLLGGCHEEIQQRINDLRQDLASYEQQASQLNENIASLSELISALDKNDHILSIRPFDFTVRTGYQIIFLSGNSIFVYNGTDGVSPIVGVRYNDNYEDYYWTIQMGESGTPTWMTDSYGQRVRATGSVPQLKIEEGLWWYSFDGSSWNKCPWGSPQVASGTAVFSSVDTSDPYYVTFTLANGTRFQLPTQKAFDELNAQCKTINETMKSYSQIISEVDSSIYVKSVTEYEEAGETGYKITLETGEVLTVRNGYNNRDSVLLSAKAYTDGKYYWVYRSHSSEDYQWLLYQGKMICVTMEDVTPYIGITDSLGVLYFTITVAGSATEMMRDADGKAVRATGRIVLDFFTAVTFSDKSKLVLTLGDGTEVELPRTRDYIPSATTSIRSDYLESDTHYTFQILLFLTDTLEMDTPLPNYAAYCEASGVNVEAIAFDDGYAESTYNVSFSSSAVTGGYRYSMILDIPFHTGPAASWNTALKSRIAIFITWQNKSIMKVVEFRRAILPSSITLDKTELNLTVGDPAVQLNATVLPSTATDKGIVWSSDHPEIATVDPETGLVTAVAEGTNCTITARSNRKSHVFATCTVNVSPAAP